MKHNNIIDGTLLDNMREMSTEDKSYKYRDVMVVSCNWSYHKRWPGTHKNVHFWVVLENGYAVGWNESPSHGWSFPLFKLKITKTFK